MVHVDVKTKKKLFFIKKLFRFIYEMFKYFSAASFLKKRTYLYGSQVISSSMNLCVFFFSFFLLNFALDFTNSMRTIRVANTFADSFMCIRNSVCFHESDAALISLLFYVARLLADQVNLLLAYRKLVFFFLYLIQLCVGF